MSKGDISVEKNERQGVLDRINCCSCDRHLSHMEVSSYRIRLCLWFVVFFLDCDLCCWQEEKQEVRK